MREFELMPNEEQMMDMAKEYSKVKARKEAMNAHSHERCSADKESLFKLSEAYCMECDLVVGVRKLYSVAPYVYRPAIERIIINKKRNCAVLLDLVLKYGEGDPEYTPDSVSGSGYCNQLKSLDFAQSALLYKLSEIELSDKEFNKVITCELMDAGSFNRLGIYCKR